jgi:hypothetical protein
MTRNQMIALGCGGAGCLGLLVVAIAGGALWYVQRSPRSTAININVNRNSNSNSSSNSNANLNSNTDTDDSSKTSSSMSDDDQHKLYHAATATKDTNTMIRVWKKLGIADSDGTPNEKYRQFAQAHIGWLFRNTEFMQEMNDEQKARDYVEAHIND